MGGSFKIFTLNYHEKMAEENSCKVVPGDDVRSVDGFQNRHAALSNRTC